MFTKSFLILNALIIGSVGVAYLIDPNLLLARYGLETGSTGMDNMLRATYGGLYLACAAIFLLGVISAARQRDSVAFVGIFMTGAAIGRMVSIVAAGSPPASIMPLLYVEIVLAIVATALFMRSKPAS